MQISSGLRFATIFAVAGLITSSSLTLAQASTAGDRWAAVRKNGVLVRDKGVVQVLKLQNNHFQVTFDRNVSRCIYTTGIGHVLPTTQAFGPSAEIFVAPAPNSTNAVLVRSENDFFLLVTCE